ncbi:MAG: type II toxin-antitoxin system RelE/ParE family toxin [Holophagales bacterium]|nr:MAG: type II toxin-antitoxin system RelE/ParE family toxin [Holophagales bacterium]
MRYRVEILSTARRDLRDLPLRDAERVLARLEQLREGFAGDVRKLQGFTVGYRLRVGDYRVLFDLDGDRILVLRIRNRREAYER